MKSFYIVLFCLPIFLPLLYSTFSIHTKYNCRFYFHYVIETFRGSNLIEISPQVKSIHNLQKSYPKPNLKVEEFRKYFDDFAEIMNPYVKKDMILEKVLISGKNSNLEGEFQKQKGDTKDKVILYLHEGYYISGSFASDRILSSELGYRTNISVLSINYRLAPENSLQDSISDIYQAYEFLEKSYKNIYLVGSGSGGGLALHFVNNYMKQKKVKAILLLSPWIDFNFKKSSIISNHHKDYFVSKDVLVWASSKVKKDEFFENNMKLKSLKGFPSMLISVGKDEILFDDSMDYAKKAKDDNVDIHMIPWIHMQHIHPIYWCYHEEGDKSLTTLSQWLKSK